MSKNGSIIRIFLYIIIIPSSILAPFAFIFGGLTLDFFWWMKLSMVIVGLLIAWLVKPLSIVTGRDLKII